MSHKKNHWGMLLFLVALALCAGALRISVVYNLQKSPFFYGNVLPILGFVLSVFVLTAGYFSYPRIHNLKVYLIGNLTGFLGAALFVEKIPIINNFCAVPEWFFNVLLLVNLFNLLIIPFFSSQVKYRSAKAATLTLLTIETVFLLILRFSPGSGQWLSFFGYESASDWKLWIGPAVFVAVFILSVARLNSEFFLGGLFSGCALIYSAIWVLNSNVQDIFSVRYEVLLVAAPIFLLIGILVHWFSKMENRVSYDPLLQIYNRDYCSKIISEQSKINSLPPFSVAMVDIDHFKNVNDTYGHQAGDAVLYEVAQAVSRGVAQAGFVCRYGGEELVVFSPQKTMKQLAEIIENVRIDIEKIKTPSGKKKISVTISAGVSQRENSTQTVMDVIHAADKALYKAKDGGRNQIKSGKIT